MVQIDKEKNKYLRVKKMKNLRHNLIKYLVGFPVYYGFIKPYEYMKTKVKNYLINLHKYNFEKVEEKSLEEMKKYLATCYSRYKEAAITDYEYGVDTSSILSIDQFLSSSYKYRNYKRKYSKIYRELFGSRVKANELKYMNELVSWMLDQGLEVKYISSYNDHGNRINLLLASER